MSHAFTFPLGGGVAFGPVVVAPASSAGPGGFYAYTRRIDPLSGDAVFDPKTGSWAADHPTASILMLCLRTPKGRAGRDPSYGLDATGLDNARPNAGATLRNAILEACARYVRLGLVAGLACETDVLTAADGSRVLLFALSFRDPLDRLVTIPGAFAG